MKLSTLLTISVLLAITPVWLCGVSGKVVINEIMYNPDRLQGDDEYYEWVELHNTGDTGVDLSGWQLRDSDPTNEPFVMPSNTEIEPGGYLVVCSSATHVYYTYGIQNYIGNFAGRFRLGNGGDTVTLLDDSGGQIDGVIYNDDYPWPFQADGVGPSLERVNPLGESDDAHNWAPSLRKDPTDKPGTPGTQNSLFSDGTAPPIVINEIHYHPACGGDDDEYVELYNASDSEMSLDGWQFTNGVFFTFPEGTTIATHEYLVVCKNPDWIKANYGIENVIGDTGPVTTFGELDNGGETIVLRDAAGRLVDFVPYSDGEYWPIAADGYGPSLECINPNLANNDQGNWAAASVTRRWVYVETSPANPTGDMLYFYLNGEGEALLDDIALVPDGGGENLVPNGDFETDCGTGVSPVEDHGQDAHATSGWVKYGNHSASIKIDTAAHSGAACMKLISTGDGGGGDCRNYVGISIPGISMGEEYVLSFWAKPLGTRGETRLTARLANSRSTKGVYAAADLAKGGFASTPGSQNSAHAENLPPFIYRVQHSPDVPTSEEPVQIIARVVDDSALSSVSMSIEYSVGEDWSSLPMSDDGQHGDGEAGDGEFGAQIPPQPSLTVVRFRVVAEDSEGGVGVSPDADDMKSSHAYFCYDDGVASNLPIYFLFVSEENRRRLQELGSRDDYVPGTFVYEGEVYDKVRVRWFGSFSERVAITKKNWRIKFNPWQKLHGVFSGFAPSGGEFKVGSLILLGGDYDDLSLRGSACLREMLTQRAFWYAGCSYSATEYVRLQLNGSPYGLMLSLERPDTDYLERNHRDRDGDLFQARSLPGQPPSNMSVLPSYDDYNFAYDRKTNRLEPHDRLVSLIENLQDKPETEIEDFFNNNLNVQSYASYLAGAALAQSWVSPSRDYYLFRGKSGAEETYLWEVMPWGGEHNWERPSLPVLNGIVGQNEYSLPNIMRTRFLNNPELESLFADRLRQLLDTIYTEQHLFFVIDQVTVAIQAEADADRNSWWPEAASLAHHAAALKTNVTARRAFLYCWLDGAEGPAQPVNLSPAAGAQHMSDPITLVASEFSAPPPGSIHQSSRWQVRAEEGLYSNAVWDSGDDPVNKTSVTLPPGTLQQERIFLWHVCYKDDQGRCSLWSDETSFATTLDTVPPSVISAFSMPDVEDEVAVVFSEPLDLASARDPSNYLLNDTDLPDAASLSADGLTVTLSVPPGLPLFSLTINNISDKAHPPNVILPDTKVSIQVWASPETKINFQPDSELAPPGYLKDAGAPFDEGRGYGWTTDVTSLARVRNVQTDPRLDTLLQFAGGESAWELALPSPAKYRVTVCIGDAASESIYDLAIEGRWVVTGLYLPANEFREVTAEVDLTDGRLTLYGGDIYQSTRVAYLDLLSSATVFRMTNVAPETSNPDWLDVTWSYVPDASYKIHWADDLSSWNAITPDPADMTIDAQAGTVTWTDKGASPGMGGLAPGQTTRRFYRVELLTP